MKALILLLALGVGETSNHNEELKPALDAYEDFRKEGCVSVTRKKLSPVTKHRPDIDTIEVWGQRVQIKCKRPVSGDTEAPVVVSVQVSWVAPTKRENLDDLLPEQISHYELYLNEALHIAQNSPFQIELIPGSYTVSMLAVDTDGLKSDRTSSVEFEIKGE